jgi:hypothetical protein
MACHGFKHLCWLNIGDHYYSINKWVLFWKYDFRTPGEAYIHNGLSWLIKVLRKGSFHNGPVMCPLSVIIALEVCIVHYVLWFVIFLKSNPFLFRETFYSFNNKQNGAVSKGDIIMHGMGNVHRSNF